MAKKLRTNDPGDAVEKMTTSMRLPVELKTRIDKAASASGRSLTQEIERRLEQSFHDEDLVPGVLAWSYGERLAGVMLAIGEVIKLAGPITRFTGSWAVSDGKMVHVPPDIASWDETIFTQNLAGKSVKLMIDILLRPGALEEFEETGREKNIDTYGEKVFGIVTLAIGGLRGERPMNSPRWDRIRALLGSFPVQPLKPPPEIIEPPADDT